MIRLQVELILALLLFSQATRRFGRNAAGDAFRQLPHQYLADQVTSERDRIDRQFLTRERCMATLMPARCQRIRSTH